ncbi:SDR family oxidoreductase [Microbacterium barkeri]|uniref:SDR family oxidoreductase n=1 Tax=Microbacterium barkeri TaxID=33917 RepID=UPI0024AF0E19|nr:SDR family oxidoreductase [Microbacterium barkeri]MDI6944243.1 SDR family oxidoreductase [Microbacterium barkeri]
MSTQTRAIRSALITGAGTGIGRATALELARRGWSLTLIGRTRETLERTAAEIAEAGGPAAAWVPADVTRPDDVVRAFDAAQEHAGRVDLLFNNAGAFGPQARIDELSDDDWQQVLDVNVTGAVLCAREAFRRMRAQTPQGGRIINNGSVSAHRPRPRSAAYTITKHAVTGLTRSVALDGRSYGITATQIDIGNAATELLHGIDAGDGALQPDGTRRVEPTFDVAHAARLIADVADLPHEVAVHEIVVTATGMPFDGRG